MKRHIGWSQGAWPARWQERLRVRTVEIQRRGVSAHRLKKFEERADFWTERAERLAYAWVRVACIVEREPIVPAARRDTKTGRRIDPILREEAGHVEVIELSLIHISEPTRLLSI